MKRAILGMSLLLIATPAFAGSLAGNDVPASLLVTRAGLEWAWASPCGPHDSGIGGCTTGELTMHHGFRVALESDWTAGFANVLDVYNAFNPAGAPSLCATPYFDSAYDHCDAGDVQIGYVWNFPRSWQPSYQSSLRRDFRCAGRGPRARDLHPAGAWASWCRAGTQPKAQLGSRPLGESVCGPARLPARVLVGDAPGGTLKHIASRLHVVH